MKVEAISAQWCFEPTGTSAVLRIPADPTTLD